MPNLSIKALQESQASIFFPDATATAALRLGFQVSSYGPFGGDFRFRGFFFAAVIALRAHSCRPLSSSRTVSGTL
jgi:hypothetical protein